MIESKFTVAPYPIVPSTPVLPDTVLYTGEQIKKKALKDKVKSITLLCLACVVVCVPVTVLTDELLAFFQPGLVFYNQPDVIEWLWLGILYVVCLVSIFGALATFKLSKQIAD